ncbi:(d)CMP kinase [Kineococcus gynurae]|uniref:Cytidylate kinase n=1 Tax=Kineococcus gynurae TaxID=452979 RepID=A0ABV5LXL9_9ACTN
MPDNPVPARRGALVVAVDGPSGSGKSSVSRAVAAELGVAFLDTGAMYRAATFSVLAHGVDLTDRAAVAAHVRGVALDLDLDAEAGDRAELVVLVAPDGARRDVTTEIRGAEVTAAVSAVAAVPEVRSDLVLRQRAIIESACAAPRPGRQPGIVAEGRDITTVVAPDADARILLTASEAVRMARRAGQDGAPDATSEAVRAAVVGRDALDARTTSFTTAADGVTTVDSTELDFAGTVAAVLAVVRR